MHLRRRSRGKWRCAPTRESGHSRTLSLDLGSYLKANSSQGTITTPAAACRTRMSALPMAVTVVHAWAPPWCMLEVLDFDFDFAAKSAGPMMLRTQHVAIVDRRSGGLGERPYQQKVRTNGDSIGPQAIVSLPASNLGVQSTCTPMPITDTEPQMQCIQSVWGE